MLHDLTKWFERKRDLQVNCVRNFTQFGDNFFFKKIIIEHPQRPMCWMDPKDVCWKQQCLPNGITTKHFSYVRRFLEINFYLRWDLDSVHHLRNQTTIKTSFWYFPFYVVSLFFIIILINIYNLTHTQARKPNPDKKANKYKIQSVAEV